MGLDELADVGRDPVRGGYSRHGYADAELTLREWFAEAAGRVGLEPETDGNGNIWAWWDGRRGPDARGHRLAPGLRPRRRRVRRAARGDQRAGRGRRAAGRGVHARAGRWRWPCSSRRRAAGSGCPAWAPGCSPARCRPPTRWAAPTGTASRWPRRCASAGFDPDRVGAGARTGWPGSARSSSCTSSRARCSPRAGRRSGGHRHRRARAVAVPVRRPGQPRRHHRDGRAARPDAGRGRDGAGRARDRRRPRQPGHRRPAAADPGRHQRDRVHGGPLAGRPGRHRGPGAGHRGRDRRRRAAAGRRARLHGRGDRGVGQRAGGLPGAAARRAVRGARATRPAGAHRGRARRRHPGRARAVRDDLRAEPDRDQPRAAGARRTRRLRGRRAGADRRAAPAGRRRDRLLVRAGLARRGPGRPRCWSSTGTG